MVYELYTIDRHRVYLRVSPFSGRKFARNPEHLAHAWTSGAAWLRSRRGAGASALEHARAEFVLIHRVFHRPWSTLHASSRRRSNAFSA